MSYMALLDQTYTIWMSNTWDAHTYNMDHPQAPVPYYSLHFRRAAQSLLEKLTGVDLSATVLKMRITGKTISVTRNWEW